MSTEANYWTGRRQVSRRTVLCGAALAGASIGLAAAGCSSSNNGNKAAATTAATSGATKAPVAPSTAATSASGASPVATRAAASADQPVSGGTFNLLQSRDVASLDPLASTTFTVPERLSLVYPRLFSYTRDPQAAQGDTKLVPSYVTDKWEFAGDGSTLTFHLKQGVKYSKTPPVNGREFVAGDVKYSIERYMTEPTSAFKARFVDVDSIQAPDNYTVVFKLKAPSAYLQYALAAEPSFITPPEIAQLNGDFKQNLVGPGPMIHDKTTQGEGSTYHKNPDFVDAAHMYYDNFQIKFVSDLSTQLAALRTNQLDFTPSGQFTSSQMDQVAKGNNAVVPYAVPNTNNYVFFFNMNNPKWKDPRARKAISKAFNRQDIIDRIYESKGTFLGPVPPGFGKWAYTDQQMRGFDAYKFDPAAAKQLWSASGVTETKVQMYGTGTYFPDVSDTTQLIMQQLTQNLGLSFDFSSEDQPTVAAKAYTNKFPDVCIFFMGSYDPLDYLIAQYYPGGARNGSGVNDPKTIAALDDMRKTLDEGQRIQKGLDLQKYLSDELLPQAHLVAAITNNVYNAKLHNFLPAVRPPGVEWILNSWKVK